MVPRHIRPEYIGLYRGGVLMIDDNVFQPHYEIRKIMRFDDLAHTTFCAQSAHLAPYMNDPYLWVEKVHGLLEPPQGFICDNDEADETTAVLMMMLEGLITDRDEPDYKLNKVLFTDICAKLWETNVREHELMMLD